MTAQYLDKEKVRQALGSVRDRLNREYGPGFDKAVCDVGMQIERGEFDAKVPQPSAVPTSGTGTAPEYGRTLEQKVKDLEIVMDDTLLCIYPGMAKDIGDLTLRVDKFEDLMGRLADSGSDLSAACITLEECIEIDREDIVDICKRISNLETSLKSLKDLEKGVEISHDRCLRLETAFKSLKEEVNGISITAENGTIYSLKVKREL